jgi:hypothetical protein
MDFGVIFVHVGDGPNNSGLLLGSVHIYSSWCHHPYMFMGLLESVQLRGPQ